MTALLRQNLESYIGWGANTHEQTVPVREVLDRVLVSS